MSDDPTKSDPMSGEQTGTNSGTFLQASAMTGVVLMGDLKTAFASPCAGSWTAAGCPSIGMAGGSSPTVPPIPV